MKHILCVGGSGALGSKVVSGLRGHAVVNVDFKEHPDAAHNILLNSSLSSQDNNRNAIKSLKELGKSFDTMVVTAGGWVGGSIAEPEYFQKVRQMSQVNLHPCLLTAHLATQTLLNPKGLVIFTGAAAVYKEPQPDMLAYALAKTGVHSLATSLASKLKEDQSVVTMLPDVIDTPANREGMPKANFSKWARPESMGELVRSWVEGLNVPPNGSFVFLKVKDGCVMPELA